jgi:hypothetical protein
MYDGSGRNVDSFSPEPSQKAIRRLAAGTYYVGITGDVASTSRGYSLTINRWEAPDSAYEPNDTAGTASAIPVNFSGDMYLSANDEDWFTFTLEQMRIVTLNLGDSSYHLQWELFNSNMETIANSHYDSNFYKKAFPAGNYYLRIAGAWNLPYSLQLSVVNIPDHDLEPNNSFNAATAVGLPFQRELYMTGQDEDWFSFDIATEQVVTFDVQAETHYGIGSALYKSNGTPVDNVYPGSGTTLAVLPAGSYRVRLANSYGESYAYTLTLTSEGIPDTSFEPNNTLAQAYNIQPGFTSGKLLVTEQDSDWFKFTLSSPTQVTIDMEVVAGGSLSANIKDGNDNHLHGLSQGSNQPVLPAGTYYLHFSGYTATKYKFSIRKT